MVCRFLVTWACDPESPARHDLAQGEFLEFFASLSVRSRNVLGREQINSWDDLAGVSHRDVKYFRSCGLVTRIEVITKAAEYGVNLLNWKLANRN